MIVEYSLQGDVDRQEVGSDLAGWNVLNLELNQGKRSAERYVVVDQTDELFHAQRKLQLWIQTKLIIHA